MIPHTIHFAFTSPPGGGDVPFSLIHYLAVASAARYAEPDRLVLHTLHEHDGEWWNRAGKLAEVRQASVPEAAFNCRFRHPAHQADAIRLDVLQREGGVFLDLDVVSLQSYRHLLGTPGGTMLGWEDELALCPAVILAAPGASFIRRWIDGYDPDRSEWQGFRSTGRDEHWGEISTRYPKYLAERHPDEITLAPPHYFYPVHWRRANCDRLFTPAEQGGLQEEELIGSFAVHLWQTGSWRQRLSQISPESVRAGRTVLDRHLATLIEGV